MRTVATQSTNSWSWSQFTRPIRSVGAPFTHTVYQIVSEGNCRALLNVVARAHITHQFSIHTKSLLFISRIQSTHIGSDALTITFTNGNALLLNLYTPQVIYLRDETDALSNKDCPSELAAATNRDDELSDGSMQSTSSGNRVFVQANGQIVHVSSDHITTKSGWEYFIQK